MATRIDITANSSQARSELASTQASVKGLEASVVSMGKNTAVTTRQVSQMASGTKRMNGAVLEAARFAEDFSVGYGMQGAAGALRASANNATQFAAILAGPWGAALATAVVIGTQLYMTYNKISESTETAADAQERFANSIKSAGDLAERHIRLMSRLSQSENASQTGGIFSQLNEDLLVAQTRMRENNRLQEALRDIIKDTNTPVHEFQAATQQFNEILKENEKLEKNINQIIRDRAEVSKKLAEQRAAEQEETRKRLADEAKKLMKQRSDAAGKLESSIRLDIVDDKRAQQIEDELAERQKQIDELRLNEHEAIRLRKMAEDAAIAKRAELEKQVLMEQAKVQQQVSEDHANKLRKALGIGTGQDAVKRGLAGISDQQALGKVRDDAFQRAKEAGATDKEAAAEARRALSDARDPAGANRRRASQVAEQARQQALQGGASRREAIAAGRQAFGAELAQGQGGPNAVEQARTQIFQEQATKLNQQGKLSDRTLQGMRDILNEMQQQSNEDARRDAEIEQIKRQIESVSQQGQRRRARAKSSN